MDRYINRPARRRILRGLAAAGPLAAVSAVSALGIAASPATAQPSTGPLSLVVAYPPGGSADILARLVAQKLGEALGRAIIVVNRPGAGGLLGLSYAAQAAPDGNTIYLCTLTTQTISLALNKNSRYDVVRDLDPIAQIASAPHVLIVNESVPARDMKSFIAWLKASPQPVNYASGYGTLSHLEGVLLQQKLQANLTNVPYKGSAQASTDLIGGAVSFMFDSVASALPFINSGKVRGLAVASSQRVAALPNLPTITEAGVAGYDVDNWFGLMAPKGTPRAAIARIETAMASTLRDPAFRKNLEESGYIPEYADAARFGQVARTETEKWADLVSSAKLSL